MSFATDLSRFSRRAEKAVDDTVRSVTFALFSEVVQRTPVDTGRLKGNWQPSVGAPAAGTLTATDKDGSTTITKIAAGIGGWGSVSYLTNNLPYASRIEYDGWSRTKAPAGMVRTSLARIRAHVARAARENKV